MWLLLRWRADLERVNAGTSAGRDLFNFNGWYNPGGATTAAGLPVISHVEGNVGTSAKWQRLTTVDQLLTYEAARRWKGSGVANGAAPIIYICFSQQPAIENANMGFVDFTQMDQAQLALTTNNENSLADINAAATADIGGNSDLAVDIVADTFNLLNFAKAQIAKPFA